MPIANESRKKAKLRTDFSDLAREMPPQAITDDAGYESTLEMVDRLMASAKLTKGQSLYLETLVQLVQAYEAANHAIEISGISGLDSLRHLLEENGLSATDLARLLGVHVGMGSKILRGDRALTIDHVKRLAARFEVSPVVFLN